MIVATAQKCLTEFEASFKILETTNLMSALGLIVIVEITKSGNVLVAGPSTIPQTKALIKILSKYELEKVFVDGAFSKTTFASISDAIIYCIGASYSNDFNKIIRDSVLKLKVFNLPQIDIKLDLENIKNIALIDKFNNIEILDISSTIIDGPKIFEKINDNTKYLYIPKVVSKSFIEAFIENRENINFDIILKSPTSLVLDERLLNKIFLLKQKIYVLKQVNIVAIAFNPFSPTGYSYDSKVFRCELEKNINLPIFNVLEER